MVLQLSPQLHHPHSTKKSPQSFFAPHERATHPNFSPSPWQGGSTLTSQLGLWAGFRALLLLPQAVQLLELLHQSILQVGL